MNFIEQQCMQLHGPYHISLDITNKCNYRCLHCYNSSGENNSVSSELSDDEVIKIIKDIASIKPYNVCFCGGEPLLKVSTLFECGNILSKVGIRNISVVSNGYFLTSDIAKQLKNHGFTNIQISLDGANAGTCYDLRQNKQAFDKAINALTILKQEQFPMVNVAFCPTKNNISELKDVHKICESLNVTRLRIQPLMVIGRANENLKNIMPSNLQYIELVKTIREIKFSGSKTDIEYGDPLEHIFKAKSRTFNLSALTMSIKSNGMITASPYLPIILGNLKKHSLKEYWRAKIYNMWSLPIVRELAEDITCIKDMGVHNENKLKTWIDKDIELDIIDDKLFIE